MQNHMSGDKPRKSDSGVSAETSVPLMRLHKLQFIRSYDVSEPPSYYPHLLGQGVRHRVSHETRGIRQGFYRRLKPNYLRRQ